MNINNFLGSREVATQVATFKVNKKCANLACDGVMVPNGRVHLTYPKDYEHKCSICEFKESYSQQYPRMEYIEI